MTPGGKKLWDVRQVIETAKANELLGFYNDLGDFVSKTGVIAKKEQQLKL